MRGYISFFSWLTVKLHRPDALRAQLEDDGVRWRCLAVSVYGIAVYRPQSVVLPEWVCMVRLLNFMPNSALWWDPLVSGILGYLLLLGRTLFLPAVGMWRSG